MPKRDIELVVQKKELPSWLWLWLVPSFLIMQLVLREIVPEFTRLHVDGELGIIENLTVVFLIPTIFMAAYLVSQSRHLPSVWLGLWYGLLGLACLFFAGEEASWGQHWLGWETPDQIKDLNDQGETNLHNMSSWLDQKPRLIVELSAIIGGVIMPIIFWKKGIVFENRTWQFLFWPTHACIPVSVIVGTIKLPDRIFGTHNIPYPFDLRVSETQELYVALAFLVYLFSAVVRFRQYKGYQ